jgi:hypothetical protein
VYGGGGVGEREKDRERDRQTDRQRERERERDRETERQRDRETEREREKGIIKYVATIHQKVFVAPWNARKQISFLGYKLPR